MKEVINSISIIILTVIIVSNFFEIQANKKEIEELKELSNGKDI